MRLGTRNETGKERQEDFPADEQNGECPLNNRRDIARKLKVAGLNQWSI